MLVVIERVLSLVDLHLQFRTIIFKRPSVPSTWRVCISGKCHKNRAILLSEKWSRKFTGQASMVISQRKRWLFLVSSSRLIPRSRMLINDLRVDSSNWSIVTQRREQEKCKMLFNQRWVCWFLSISCNKSIQLLAQKKVFFLSTKPTCLYSFLTIPAPINAFLEANLIYVPSRVSKFSCSYQIFSSDRWETKFESKTEWN